MGDKDDTEDYHLQASVADTDDMHFFLLFFVFQKQNLHVVVALHTSLLVNLKMMLVR